MACGCGRAKVPAAATSSANASEATARYEVRDNAGQVAQFATRPEAQIYLARNGGVLRPI